jgi:hypothetical protein
MLCAPLGSIIPQSGNIMDSALSSKVASKRTLPPRPREPPPSFNSKLPKAEQEEDSAERFMRGIQHLRELASCPDLAAQVGRPKAMKVGSLLRRVEMELRLDSPVESL